MKISDQLVCLFSGQVEERDGSYVLELPEQELQLGEIAAGESYRVAVLSTPEDQTERKEPEQRESPVDPEPSSDEDSGSDPGHDPDPPIDRGETRIVDIESIGDQGDGITRVERGFVVIVPDTEKGERVRIEITDVGANVAFADVVERMDYYE